MTGVSQALISGADKSAVRVQVNPAALASTGLGLEDVRTFLGQVNVELPKGSVDGKNASYTLYSNDQLFQAEDYQNLVMRQINGTPVRLGSIAGITNGVENNQRGGWAGSHEWGGMRRAVLVIIFKQPDANVIETVERIRAVLPQTEKWLPPNVQVKVLEDRTYTIRASVNDVQTSLLISISLVVMVIFLFLRRLWPTVIASVTVPLALAGTFAVMYLFHFSVDNLSLMAVTISVGFVVDDAIVVIENVFRFVEVGESPFAAAVKGARQIGFTVVSMSISLVAVFIPLLFMGGLVGRLFHEFAVTLSAAILVSGVISLTLTPMMCARFLKKDAPDHRDNFLQRASESGFNRMLDYYAAGLRWVLQHQYVMLGATLLTIAVTVWFYQIVPKGFFPQQDTGLMMGTTEAAQDISFKSMAALQDRIAKIVQSDPDVETIGSFIGGGFGSSSVNNGRFFVSLKQKPARKSSVDEIMGRLRRQCGVVPGITLFLAPMQDIRVGGRASKAQYQYALQSGELEELNVWAPRMVSALRKLPQLKDVNSDQLTHGLQTNVVVDRDAAVRLGLSPQAVDNVLYDAFGQRQVSTLYKRYNQHHVVMEVSPEYLEGPSALSKIFALSSTGKQVPLSAVAKFVTSNSFLSVNHQGQFPAVTLSFNLTPGVSLSDATDLVKKASQDLHLPSSITGSFQGTAQVFQASLSSTPLLLLAALVTVYVVLGMLYESLIHPITILSTLPSAGLGALLALMLTGDDLSMVSFIGIILLIGIVKKNAIMMIDFALEAEREGLTPEEAIYKACVIRFRPIMMTTMAALLGTLPLALGLGAGSELRRPLGVAVVGGLIVSQVLTLYTTPVIYLFFEHLKLRFSGRRPATPVIRAGEEAAIA